ncbi:DUF4011 domain-containing protein [Nocardioides ultimimeridianus]
MTSLRVDLAHVGAIGFSHANARFPVITELSVSDTAFAGSANVRMTVRLTCLGQEMAEPWEIEIPHVGAEPVVFQGPQIQLVLKPLAFAEVDERLAGEFVVELASDAGVAFTRTFPVDIVAYNQWQLYPSAETLGESLATLAPFVQPNHPAVEGVLRRARDILEAQTKSASTEGYQGDTQRVIDIVQAIYLALQARRIRYSDPPASWDADVQKIRLVPDVVGVDVASGVGTCLDTTITFASCLAAAGLNPVLIIITGHALVGVMTGEEIEGRGKIDRLPESVVTDLNVFKTLVDGHFLLPVETTVLTASTPVAFDEAVRAGSTRLASAAFAAITDGTEELRPGGFVGAVDVSRAHHNGLRPLPAVLRRGDAVEIVEYRPFTPPDFVQAATPVRTSASGRVLVDNAPGRVQNWKRALLDLSGNNPLLKLPSRDTVARAFVPPGALGRIEDHLHRGGSLRLYPYTEVTQEDVARGVQSIAQLDADDLAARLFRDGLLFLTYGADTYLTRLRGLARKARSSLEESGSTSLFAGFGILKWELEGKAMESPLILAPMKLTGGTGRNKLFELSLDESGTSTPNFCLLEKLEEQFEIKIPGLREPQEDGAGIDVDAALQAVREALIQHQLSFSVEEGLVLGNFQFSTFRIWKDVDDHWSRFLEAPVVRHLVESFNEDYPTPSETSYAAVDLPLPADESQYEAIQAAINGETFVLEGPPGTGKSQTITNIVAGALASGKRVLFVAEKPAALEVVKQRLDAVGVGAFCLDLHGRTRKRAEVAAAIRNALEIQTGVDRVEVDTIRVEMRSTARELDRYAEALHSTDGVGYSVWSARQRLLAAGEGPSLDLDLDGVTLSDEQLASIRQALENYPDTARLAESQGDQPWLLAGSGPRIDDVAPGLARLAQVVQALPTAHPVLGAAVRAVTSAQGFETLLRIIAQPLPATHVIDQVTSPGWEHLFQTWRTTVDQWATTPPPVLARIDASILNAPIDQWLESARQAAASGMFGRKAKLRDAAQPLAAFSATAVEPDQLVAVLEQLMTVRSQVADLRHRLAAAVPGMELPEGWHPYGSEGVKALDARRVELAAVAELLSDDTATSQALRSIPGNAVSLDQVTAANLRLVAEEWRAFLANLDADDATVERWLAGRPLVDAWSVSIPAWRADQAEGFRRLRRFADLHGGLQPLSAAGFDKAVEQLVTGEVSAFDALSAFERGLARASLHRLWHVGALDRFDAEAHDVRVHRFATADSRWRKVQSAVIPDLAAERRPFSPGTVTGQVGELLREVNKVRGGKPLRFLLEHYHETLSAIMPCFLMSPESVAQFLRPGLFTFDLVVIDEASQVRVAEAVGALGRAKSAVIVGDSKQMPPTGFGGSRFAEQEWDPYAEVSEIPADQESILTECIQSRIPRRWLSWHYRSQSEGLIAFSNANYYEGRLASFPTPNDSDPRMGLRLRPVAGKFLRSGKGAELRTNPIEAAAVVDDVRRRLHDPEESGSSIGIVTFNAQQQALIDSMLLDSDDELIREAYNREGDARLFVKNLENVQGDERDVILFSIGYSKDDNGKLPLQWGPLNAEGGERRLNVAITRARKQVVVFCSFQPEDIDLSRTGAKAIADLRNYLLIARDGVESNAALIARKPGETDRHRGEIAARLRAAGLVVDEDKGLSDFRVDLVVASPGNPERPALVILLDGPRWARGRRTQDRDVVPVEVLGALMGWPDVMRIWLPDWVSNADLVVERVRARADAAQAELAKRNPVVDRAEETPTDPVREPAAVLEPAGVPEPAAVLEHPDVPEADVQTASSLDSIARVVAEDTTAPESNDAIARSASPESAMSGEVDAGGAEFVPASAGVIGAREVLDALPDPEASALVRAQLLDVIDAEGPVAMARLLRLTARRFNLNTVRAARAAEILRLVPRERVRTSRQFGDFAWPARLDPTGWTGFRYVDPDASRTLEEVAPEEIRNAMRAVLDEFEIELADDLLRRTAELFGVTRLGANVRSRLEGVYHAYLVPNDGESPTED